MHNDLYIKENKGIKLSSNNSGGTLGGLTSGQDIVFY